MDSPTHVALMAILRQKISRAGRITFAEFIQTALYHPIHGYYQRPAPKIGKEGDYYTSADLHTIFGRLVAKQMAELWHKLERPRPFLLVEIGAGKGLLALDILNALQSDEPALLDHLQLHLSETSPYHREKQKENLRAWLSYDILHWTDWPALENLHGIGCVISNEWFDALPVHRVYQNAGRLEEVYVVENAGRLEEVHGELSSPRLEEYFGEQGIALQDHQYAEINLSALYWMERISRILDKGFVITIDYGYLADELYSPWRPQGTRQCYYRHNTSADPFAHLGEQDITAHVNFSDLIRQGEALGWLTACLTSQKNFLMGLGLASYLDTMAKTASCSSARGNAQTDDGRGEELLSPQSAIRNSPLPRPDPIRQINTRLAIKNLIMPDGMGEVFKVLIQYKGVDKPELSGCASAAAWKIERV
ncbi:MAG: SAM-dependent methyltransferase [Acidobacteria bacterium]|nr:SAM-dependent methyltransferase [Acidobacteriota bacterium]MBI3654795.1 SAM-dependent methyltransferase [Acidobacteriota bacterium]